ncbi:MAG: transposase [Acidobacteriota bacterium]
MKKSTRYSSEVRDRAVRLVREGIKEHGSEWSAIVSIAEKIGCSPETLRKWLRQKQIDRGERAGTTSEERARIKRLERENRELRRANEILRKAAAFFAQAEFDRPPK